MKRLSVIAVLILLIIASCTKKSAPTVTKEPALDGAPIYAQNCARCHGADGSGGRAPDLRQGGHGKSDIMETVANGAGRMPAFADKLSAKEIEAVAIYVTNLGK